MFKYEIKQLDNWLECFFPREMSSRTTFAILMGQKKNDHVTRMTENRLAKIARGSKDFGTRPPGRLPKG